MKIIKKIIRECKITSGFYRFLSKIKYNFLLIRQKGNFEKNSCKVMKEVQLSLSECCNISMFFFMFGTLLGVYRDKKLIKNDMDIDVGVYLLGEDSLLDFRTYMESKGFCLIHFYLLEDGRVIQDSYEKHGIKIDIAFLQQSTNCDYCFLMYEEESKKENVLLFPFVSVNEIEKYAFSDFQINVPKHTEQYLADTYGEDWKQPNPKYKYWENPNAKNTEFTASIVYCNKGEGL